MWERLCRFREKLIAVMTANNYDKIVNRLIIVVKEVANEMMRDDSVDLPRNSKNPTYEAVIHTALFR